ncbi:TIGR02117 family protein [Weeksellaceae bacterium A-14]|uniref:TIGR02117 family protein n=1 Tax=Daejeonia sp. YH14 TaxID=3439042 RepID=UPI0031E49A05
MKKALHIVLKCTGIILGLVALYIFCGYFVPYISVSAEQTTEPKTTDIYLLTNGMHTDIVVPVKSKYFDWSKEIPVQDTRGKGSGFRYLGIGWGDKGFYLDTPTWAELKFSVAVKAAFWMGQSAMHCTYYRNMKENKDCVKIPLTDAQYRHLITYINRKFDRDPNGKVKLIRTNAVYGDDDSFYDANGSYSFLNTCNTWTNNALKVAGQKAALWTPTDFGIFQHYR